MTYPRRVFLKQVCGTGIAGAGVAMAPRAHASAPAAVSDDAMGVLVDLNLCVGCRLCEYACREGNGIETGPLESYDDQSVFAEQRRPAPDALTVVNAFEPEGRDETVYAKTNCMHCNHPACVSACIVGALEKQEGGAVTYDASKCIGCRYCMVACPFQVPAYEYDNVLTPRVRKCTFCVDRTRDGEQPACVEACPRQAMIYGKRSELLALAHERIRESPDQYVDHVYGEHEVGGTSWMYLSPAPFDQVGMLELDDKAPGHLTEAIQHGVFKYWIAPIALYSGLAMSAFFTRPRKGAAAVAEVEARDIDGWSSADEPAADLPDRIRERAGDLAPATLGAEASAGAMAATAVPTAPTLPIEPEPDDAPGSGDGNGREPHIGGNGHAPGNGRARRGADHAQDEHHAAPVRQKLLTPGVWMLIGLVAAGLAAGAYRFIFGLEASTNLDQQHPWGLWIAMDVGSGIALAGGGFVTAALVHIFHREHYHAIARSALVCALLGYTFYVPGLLADLGRWYNLWHPTLPSMWQVNSVLFEVGICVMIYLNVQYAELMPIVCERFMGEGRRWPRLAGLARFVHCHLERIMPALLILGVALSFFHQSSLGNLMVIAPHKLHPLWWTPVSPILFLLSAMMVGFPMVIFTILFASRSLNRKPEMHVLAPLGRYVPVFLTAYLGVKIGDIVYREAWTYLLEPSVVSVSWMVEVVGGVVLPLLLLLQRRIRRSPRGLGLACLAVVLGVVLNRLNVFILGYHPPYADGPYYPTLVEIALSVGLVAALMLVYRVAVTYLPILSPRPPLEPA